MKSKSKSQNNSAPKESRISFLSGNWIPHHELRLSVDDLGVRAGVIAVERLRTYSRRLYEVQRHLARWQRTTATLAISGLPEPARIAEYLIELLARNQALVAVHGDVGVTMIATPGLTVDAASTGTSTFALHLNTIDHQHNRQRARRGQPLIVTEVRQPPNSSWPRSIKVRSRIHYFLADAEARKREQDASGILLDDDGSLTESSISNLAIVKNGSVVSPPDDRVLGGVTQAVIESIAQREAIPWTKRPIWRDECVSADEVLLMGTDGGIWFARSVDGTLIGNGRPGKIFQLLQQRFEAVTDSIS